MKRIDWKFYLGISLLAFSALFYAAHYIIFRDLHHIFIYLIGDIAFVFIEVLMVTLIIHQVLEVRERRGRLQKLNMVIGAFFSEVGNSILKQLASADTAISSAQSLFSAKDGDQTLITVENSLTSHKATLKIGAKELETLKSDLADKKPFLLRLLENQNLLEHESFTDTLWAVFHLVEELDARDAIAQLPDADIMHLTGDATRAYRALSSQWLAYMKHLKISYPYLYSLAIRINPFDRNASPIISAQ